MGWKYNGGLLLIITAVIVWVTSAEVTQDVFTSYKHPFVVTYIGTSLTVLYLPIVFIKHWTRKLLLRHGSPKNGCNARTNNESMAGFDSPAKSTTADSSLEIELQDPKTNKDCATDLCSQQGMFLDPEKQNSKLALREIAIVVCYIAPLWFFTEYFTNAALARTSVASTTLLSSTSGIFTLVIGALMGEESINLVKVVSVVISMAGVAMTAASKTWVAGESNTDTSNNLKNSKETLLGDLFAVLSAFTMGLFTVLLKKFAGGGERVDMDKLLGCIGLFILGAHWWLVWPLTATRIEPKLALPHSRKIEGVILTNSFVGNVVCDYLWALGVVWTSPLVASLGISLTIPLAMLEDMIIHGRHYSSVYVIGSFQVFMGFVIVNVADWISQQLKSWRSQRQNKHILAWISMQQIDR